MVTQIPHCAVLWCQVSFASWSACNTPQYSLSPQHLTYCCFICARIRKIKRQQAKKLLLQCVSSVLPWQIWYVYVSADARGGQRHQTLPELEL